MDWDFFILNFGFLSVVWHFSKIREFWILGCWILFVVWIFPRHARFHERMIKFSRFFILRSSFWIRHILQFSDSNYSAKISIGNFGLCIWDWKFWIKIVNFGLEIFYFDFLFVVWNFGKHVIFHRRIIKFSRFVVLHS